MDYLGYTCLDHIIVVFNNCEPPDIKDRNAYYSQLTKDQKVLLDRIRNRHVMIPSIYALPKTSPETCEELDKLKKFITSIDKSYTESIFHAAYQARQAEERRQKEEFNRSLDQYYKDVEQ